MNRTGARWWVPLSGAAAVLLLAGCTSAPADFGPETARQLQAQVLAVSQAAANHDGPAAASLLGKLDGELDTAAAAGRVTFARYQSIKRAIDRVRADLDAAAAGATGSSPAAHPALNSAAATDPAPAGPGTAPARQSAPPGVVRIPGTAATGQAAGAATVGQLPAVVPYSAPIPLPTPSAIPAKPAAKTTAPATSKDKSKDQSSGTSKDKSKDKSKDTGHGGSNGNGNAPGTGPGQGKPKGK